VDVRCKKSENSNLTDIHSIILRINIPFFVVFMIASLFSMKNGSKQVEEYVPSEMTRIHRR
jgi:hypothetical protein